MQIEDIIKALRVAASWELTERFEYSKTQTAKILEITPAAVSQYVSGKRGNILADRIRSSKRFYPIVSVLSEELSEDYAKGSKMTNKRLLDAAQKLLPIIQNMKLNPDKKLDMKNINKVLRKRIIEEQKAATECENIGHAFKDSIVKQLIAIIEIDSIRHAEMVSLIMERLNKQRPEHVFKKSEIKLIEKMIKIEETADDSELSEIKNSFDQLSKILIESIEHDERKHSEMLRKMSDMIE